jgi:hypothetical protein
MDHLASGQQLLVEHQTLGHITSALRATIGWKYPATNLSRKLESLRFVGESFKRHLKHLMELEEQGGYMSVVVTSRPESKEEVEKLQGEHAQFRKSLTRILARLRAVAPADRDTLESISQDLLGLLEQLDAHGKREVDLLQDALLTDEGGEG